MGISLGLFLLTMVAGWHWLYPTEPPEPTWGNLRLSEWLEAYDASLRFEVDDGRHPTFTDAEIAAALDGIGTNALPCLQRWLLMKPNRFKSWCNIQLLKLRWLLPWCSLSFGEETQNYQRIAETGFMYYQHEARPLLPWLIQLSQSHDADLRGFAYEAAFFMRPDRDIFLPLADQALQDPAAGCDEAAVQWMAERFPKEALKRGFILQVQQAREDRQFLAELEAKAQAITNLQPTNLP